MAKKETVKKDTLVDLSALEDLTVIEDNGIKFVKLTENFFGNPYLEGQERLVPLELWAFMYEAEKVKAQMMKFTKRQGELNKEKEPLFIKYREFFAQDDNNPKLFIFSAGKLEMEAEVQESYVIKTHLEKTAPPISNQELNKSNK